MNVFKTMQICRYDCTNLLIADQMSLLTTSETILKNSFNKFTYLLKVTV